ncbi:(d)CMP kinase [Tissierellaceae bacterium HCP3S3_D8]
MTEAYYSIAIDGPAGAGKSTIAKKVSETLKIEYIDTGAMYRALTLKVLRNNIDPMNEEKIVEIAKSTEIYFKNNKVYLDHIDVSEEIRNNIISQNVSHISKIGEVRNRLVNLQRNMALEKNIVMDGRDIGTVVLPNAQYKFFLTATVVERATRRYKELLDRGVLDVDLDSIISDIIERDSIDSNREISPLKQAKDAYLLDTTDKSIEECVDYIVSIVLRRNK